MNTKSIGEASEAKILAALIASGKVVLLPFGDNQRYDMAIDNGDGTISRVQCKTGRMRGDVIQFSACSSAVHRANGKRRSYHGQVEYMAVYCSSNDKCYLIPIAECPATMGTLRLEKQRNPNGQRIMWAREYEIH